MDNFNEYLYSKFLQSDGVSIDTRKIEPGNLFFALSGPNFNANQFAGEALEKGASFAVVDQEAYATDDRIILAKNSEQALQDLATFHRSRFKRSVLAITGSNGKTTTKELIARVLAKKYIVHATAGNYNNHLGVPLTLLHIHPQVEIAIIEMGANHVGEISQLCSFANPTHGIITNIGEAHTETFGGIEGVLRGKSELFDHLRKTGGKPFINIQDDRLSNMQKRFSEPVLFPNEDLRLISSTSFLHVELKDQQIETNLVGAYNFGNIAAAVAVGRNFKVPDEDILDAIGTYVPDNQRSQIIKVGALQIINDSYNANPTSMRAAIRSLVEMSGKRIAVLGDMNEVERSAESHRELGVFIDQLGLDEVFLVGNDMRHAHEVVKGSHWFEDKAQLEKQLRELEFEQGNVLLKASRSMKLESVIDQLKG